MVSRLEFNEEETKKLAKIAEYYDVIKELIIFGEQVDPEHRTQIQSINELRNCLDHIMRTCIVKLGLNQKDLPSKEEYISRNLDKAFGHVYRAGYDALDWIALTLQEQIVCELKDISNLTIQHIMPDYYTRIKPRFLQIMNDEIASLRKDKDVAIANEENFIKYGEVVSELKDLSNQVMNKKPSLIEYEKKSRSDKRKQILLVFALGIFATLAGQFIINIFSS